MYLMFGHSRKEVIDVDPHKIIFDGIFDTNWVKNMLVYCTVCLKCMPIYWPADSLIGKIYLNC